MVHVVPVEAVAEPKRNEQDRIFTFQQNVMIAALCFHGQLTWKPISISTSSIPAAGEEGILGSIVGR